jgi:hypothetical protein
MGEDAERYQPRRRPTAHFLAERTVASDEELTGKAVAEQRVGGVEEQPDALLRHQASEQSDGH